MDYFKVEGAKVEKRMIEVDTGKGLIGVVVPKSGTVNDVCDALEAIGSKNNSFFFMTLAPQDGTDGPILTTKEAEDHFRGRLIKTMMLKGEYQLDPNDPIADAILDGEVVIPLFEVD